MDGVALSADLGGHDGEEDGTRSLTVSDAINAMGFGKFQVGARTPDCAWAPGGKRPAVLPPSA